MRQLNSQRRAMHSAEAARSLESAAAILFLQLIFPDRAPALVKRLAWMGALSMGAHAARALVPEERKEQLARKIRHTGSCVLEKVGQGKSAPIRGVCSSTTCKAGSCCSAKEACVTCRQFRLPASHCDFRGLARKAMQGNSKLLREGSAWCLALVQQLAHALRLDY
jgi:hypothetical protein